MILPNRGLSQDRALLTIGSEVLHILSEPRTVSRAWEDLRRAHKRKGIGQLPYDWFILALDFLYAIDAIAYEGGMLKRRKS